LANLAVGKSHSAFSFQFSPATATKLRLQSLSFSDRQVDSYDFDTRHFAEQFKVLCPDVQRNNEPPLAQLRPNAPAHHKRPTRSLSGSAEPQPGGDAVARMGSRDSGTRVFCPHLIPPFLTEPS
jgi:hypothetical protein